MIINFACSHKNIMFHKIFKSNNFGQYINYIEFIINFD